MATKKTVFGKSLDLVEIPNTSYSEAFIDAFQTQYLPANAEPFTIGQVIEATERVESTFKQFPLDEKRVAALAKSIFADDGALVKPIELARLTVKDEEGQQLFNISGRHRTEAIKLYFDAFDVPAEDYHKLDILCQVVDISTEAQLVKLIEASNGSRTVRKSEQGHLLLQELGAGADGIKSIAGTVLKADITDADKAKLLGQFFVRFSRQDKLVKTETALGIGAKVGKFILDTAKQEEFSNLKTTDVSKLMTHAWAVLTEVIKSDTSVSNKGRAVGALAEQVCTRLQEDWSGVLAKKPAASKKRHLEVVQVNHQEDTSEDVDPEPQA